MTEATYEIDYDIANDSKIIDLMRLNLKTDDDDLLEITIMRLGIRSNDLTSLNKILDIFKCNSNDLVMSACIHALSSLKLPPDKVKEVAMVVEARLASSEVDDWVKNLARRELKLT